MKTLLFDVDGTLTMPMDKIQQNMIDKLTHLKNNGYNLSIVGGSDYAKIATQLEGALHLFDYICSENGLVTYHKDNIYKESLLENIGDDAYQALVNIIMKELSNITIPVKRDRFIELRTGCINVSPIGRSCSYTEREQFYNYDLIHNIRKKLINTISPFLEQYGLTAAIGGMISIDIYQLGHDKTYCLKYFKDDDVYFFGDKTEPGGNDYNLYISDKVTGIHVDNPSHLISLLNEF